MQLWRSERLLYRGVDKEDEAFLTKLDNDEESYLNSSPLIPLPRSKKTSEGFREFLEKCLLAAIVCIPSEEDPLDPAKATPIGFVHLGGGNEPIFVHHRHSDIGLGVSRPYQGKGYGSETLRWVTEWGFRRGNLHRIGIGAFAFNTGAIRLYQRLGFTVEGRKRDFLWHDGKYNDIVEMSMLEGEWRDRYGPGSTATSTEGKKDDNV